MRVMWIVFSKEFLDIIRDRRRFLLTLLTTFIFFPLIIIVSYSYLITRAVKQQLDVLTVPVMGLEHAPALMTYLAEEQDIHAIPADDVKALVKSKQYQVGLIIPADFEEKIESRQAVELTLVTDRRRTTNIPANRLEQVLAEYRTGLMKTRLKERGLAEDFFTPLTVKKENAATSTETTGSMLALIIPGMVISIALTAGMPITVSSIAGEKKKLTLEPALFTTVNRFQLVFAKLLAVITSVLITLIGLGVVFLGSLLLVGIIVARNLPVNKIISSATGRAAEVSAANPLSGGYHLSPAAILLFVLAPFLIILLGAAFQIMISTWARNDEEATAYLAPLSLFSGLIVIAAFILDDFIPQLWHYAIPIFGTILSMRDLLSNKVDPASLTVMFATSALYAFLMIVLAGWMFNREEVVFRT